MREDNWPLLTVSKGFFETLATKGESGVAGWSVSKKRCFACLETSLCAGAAVDGGQEAMAEYSVTAGQRLFGRGGLPTDPT
jgi:hypothetical protein